MHGLCLIAVGEVCRKVVYAVASNILSPLQVGVGVPVDCEANVYSVNHVRENGDISPRSI